MNLPDRDHCIKLLNAIEAIAVHDHDREIDKAIKRLRIAIDEPYPPPNQTAEGLRRWNQLSYRRDEHQGYGIP